MNRLVFNAFKAVMLAIIFVFVWDMGFFLFRTMNLHQRMLLVTGQMVSTVQANNYMPSEFWIGTGDSTNPNGVYASILKDIADTMNSGDNFVLGYNINYSEKNSGFSVLPGTKDASVIDTYGRDVGQAYLHTKMNTPAYYGDMMVVYLQVGVACPFWSMKTENNVFIATNEDSSHKKMYSIVRLDYRYVVPCLHYVKQSST